MPRLSAVGISGLQAGEDVKPYGMQYIPRVAWTVLVHSDFDAEFAALDELLQDELLAHARLLAEFGPSLGRPTVNTLKGSRHPNLTQLRFGWQ